MKPNGRKGKAGEMPEIESKSTFCPIILDENVPIFTSSVPHYLLFRDGLYKKKDREGKKHLQYAPA